MRLGALSCLVASGQAKPRFSRAAWPTKPVAQACAKKVPTPTSTMPVSTCGKCEDSISGRPIAATASEPHIVRPCAKARHHLACKQRRHHGRQEYEIDEAEFHPSERQRRAHQHEIDEGKRADEGEQDAEADGEGRRAAAGCANGRSWPPMAICVAAWRASAGRFEW